MDDVEGVLAGVETVTEDNVVLGVEVLVKPELGAITLDETVSEGTEDET